MPNKDNTPILGLVEPVKDPSETVVSLQDIHDLRDEVMGQFKILKNLIQAYRR